MANRIEELMNLAAGCGDDLRSVDEAEERIIEFSRQLNAQVLSCLCQGKERQVSARQAADPELRAAKKLWWYTTFGVIVIWETLYRPGSRAVRDFCERFRVSCRRNCPAISHTA